MKMKSYVAGPIDANNYLLWDESSKDAIVVDCSSYNEELLEDVEREGLAVKYIFLTHGHFDHVLGVNQMSKKLGAKVGINKSDVIMLDNINEYGMLFGFPYVEPPMHDFVVNDGDIYEVGSIKVKAISTPGHTEGGVCYLIENNLYTGDTLFKGSYGRTDLFGGDFNKIKSSIKDVIFKLSDDIKVYPGHGEFSSLEYEKKYNEINA